MASIWRPVHVWVIPVALSLLVMLVSAHAGEVRIGERLPPITLRGLNGPARSLATFHGRPLLINVWASWCGPCRQEMASLERLAWRHEGRDLAIIGISTDDNAQLAIGLLHSNHATISHFIDAHRQMEALLGASRIPVTVLVDDQGRLVARFYGAQQWDSPAALKLLRDTLIAQEMRQAGPPVSP
jgi:thiol-disulfide isomerase/thioredoxin